MHCDTDLPSRAVTNRLSEVSSTHDDTAHLERFKLFSYTTRAKDLNMASHTSMAYHTSMERGEA